MRGTTVTAIALLAWCLACSLAVCAAALNDDPELPVIEGQDAYDASADVQALRARHHRRAGGHRRAGRLSWLKQQQEEMVVAPPVSQLGSDEPPRRPAPEEVEGTSDLRSNGEVQQDKPRHEEHQQHHAGMPKARVVFDPTRAKIRADVRAEAEAEGDGADLRQSQNGEHDPSAGPKEDEERLESNQEGPVKNGEDQEGRQPIKKARRKRERIFNPGTRVRASNPELEQPDADGDDTAAPQPQQHHAKMPGSAVRGDAGVGHDSLDRSSPEGREARQRGAKKQQQGQEQQQGETKREAPRPQQQEQEQETDQKKDSFFSEESQPKQQQQQQQAWASKGGEQPQPRQQQQQQAEQQQQQVEQRKGDAQPHQQAIKEDQQQQQQTEPKKEDKQQQQKPEQQPQVVPPTPGTPAPTADPSPSNKQVPASQVQEHKDAAGPPKAADTPVPQSPKHDPTAAGRSSGTSTSTHTAPVMEQKKEGSRTDQAQAAAPKADAAPSTTAVPAASQPTPPKQLLNRQEPKNASLTTPSGSATTTTPAQPAADNKAAGKGQQAASQVLQTPTAQATAQQGPKDSPAADGTPAPMEARKGNAAQNKTTEQNNKASATDTTKAPLGTTEEPSQVPEPTPLASRTPEKPAGEEGVSAESQSTDDDMDSADMPDRPDRTLPHSHRPMRARPHRAHKRPGWASFSSTSISSTPQATVQAQEAQVQSTTAAITATASASVSTGGAAGSTPSTSGAAAPKKQQQQGAAGVKQGLGQQPNSAGEAKEGPGDSSPGAAAGPVHPKSSDAADAAKHLPQLHGASHELEVDQTGKHGAGDANSAAGSSSIPPPQAVKRFADAAAALQAMKPLKPAAQQPSGEGALHEPAKQPAAAEPPLASSAAGPVVLGPGQCPAGTRAALIAAPHPWLGITVQTLNITDAVAANDVGLTAHGGCGHLVQVGGGCDLDCLGDTFGYINYMKVHANTAVMWWGNPTQAVRCNAALYAPLDKGTHCLLTPVVVCCIPNNQRVQPANSRMAQRLGISQDQA